MSLILPRVSRIEGLSPFEKLVLWDLAAFRNDSSGQCNPSVETLSRRTGLPPETVRATLKTLTKQGLVARTPETWIFPQFVHSEPAPVPDDYFPSQATIYDLSATYPQYDFDLREAVDDFISFCQRTNRSIPPEHLDDAFVRNLSLRLRGCRPGKVSFSTEARRGEAGSVLSLLSGRD